jgi:peptidoglycan-N-acetylglucosamine deacetylase
MTVNQQTVEETKQQIRGLVNEIANRGHSIANHSYDHSSMDGMSFDEFEWQVQETERAAQGHMTPCLRPPYGHTDGNTESFAAELGYEIIMWDVDSRDFEQPGADVIVDNVLDDVEPGDIVLMHDGGSNRAQTVEALPTIMQQLVERGYQFAAVC